MPTPDNKREYCEVYFDPCYENGRIIGGIYTCDKCDMNLCTPAWNKESAEKEHQIRKSIASPGPFTEKTLAEFDAEFSASDGRDYFEISERISRVKSFLRSALNAQRESFGDTYMQGTIDREAEWQ